MAHLQYTPRDYLMYLNFSNARHILVEGHDDKRFFEIIIDQATSQTNRNSFAEIMVDSADILVNFGTGKMGNREKVETICTLVSSLPVALKFVGFVDREFREFNIESSIIDTLEGYKVSHRLVWTRGHSIENYCFDFQSLRRPLRALSGTVHFRDALQLFQSVFEDTLRLASVITLIGKEFGILRRIRASVTNNIFEIATSRDKAILAINLDSWKRQLVKRNNIPERIAEQIIQRFSFWKDVVYRSELSAVRWMCHGHIGHTVIWAVYSYCIFKISMEANKDEVVARHDAQQVLKAEEGVRLNLCVDIWVQENLYNGAEFPLKVFELLGVQLA